jgi:hypothetical protein
VIDHAQAEELANARLRATVFQLGQPAIGNLKPFVVAFGLSYSPACLFYVAHSDAAPVAQQFKFLSSRHSGPHDPLGLSLGDKLGAD